MAAVAGVDFGTLSVRVSTRRVNNFASETVLHQVKLPELRRAALRKTFGRGIRMKRMLLFAIFSGALLMTTLAPIGATPQPGSTTKKSFGKTPDGQAVDLYVLTNKTAAQASITNFGGAPFSPTVPPPTATPPYTAPCSHTPHAP